MSELPPTNINDYLNRSDYFSREFELEAGEGVRKQKDCIAKFMKQQRS